MHALVDFRDRHPKAEIAGCRLEEPNGTPQRSAFRFQSPASEFESSLKLGLVPRLLKQSVGAPLVRDQTFATDWVAGACMIICKEAFRDIGFLDGGITRISTTATSASMHAKPVDRPRTCHLVHLVGKTTGVSTVKSRERLPSYLFEARRRYFLKNHSPVYAAMADLSLIIGLALWRVIFNSRQESTTACFLIVSVTVFFYKNQINGSSKPSVGVAKELLTILEL